ncbi:MAG: DUF2780 domain-containing protein [Sulfurimonas sp.]|uniref:DUF2780 domain-containing protein n=1 Tax=Sulfurimonas sp. TaxID=2022749 RepID=UPI00262956C9|nr:DUF2780 domain-containing protein [Sulfurimonas sp.]MDD2651494.1 DUF2780 domain-containing protein [Sulfurimonas sp.]MDD3451035.1 DUF2780 domain-containing protein [Sulfurimonas sp.]
MKKIVVTGFLALSLAVQVSALDVGSALNAAVQGATKTTTMQSNELITSLASLGVTPTQAAGGSAVLLSNARQKMELADYNKLLKDAPALDQVLDKGYATSTIASKTATTQEQFRVLGMDASMIAPFKGAILNYAKTKTSPALVDALAAAMQ